MAKLVLHIGAHKTGTTYLQHLFYKNRAMLADAGIFYPDICRHTAHNALAGVWFDMQDVPNSVFDQRGPNGLWDDLVRDFADRDGTVFLSGENFSRCRPHKVDMKDLARRLSAFETVKIIYTMRSPTELIQAIWLQSAKKGRPQAVNKFIKDAMEDRRVAGVWIDPNSVYDFLRTGFDPDQIHFFDYGTCRDAPGGIAQAVLGFLGARLAAQDLVAPHPSDTNISPDPLSYWVATQISDVHPVHPTLLDAVRGPLCATGRRNTLLARHEYVKLAGRYTAAIEKLVDRLQATQPGFAFVDAAPPDDMIYREEIPDQVWMEITRRVHELPSAARRAGDSLAARARLRLERLVTRS